MTTRSVWERTVHDREMRDFFVCIKIVWPITSHCYPKKRSGAVMWGKCWNNHNWLIKWRTINSFTCQTILKIPAKIFRVWNDNKWSKIVQIPPPPFPCAFCLSYSNTSATDKLGLIRLLFKLLSVLVTLFCCYVHYVLLVSDTVYGRLGILFVCVAVVTMEVTTLLTTYCHTVGRAVCAAGRTKP
jgi:hypothetical protein